MSYVLAAEQRIMVAVDWGEESMHALRWCLSNLAAGAGEEDAQKNKIILLFARPLAPAYSPLDAAGYLFPDETRHSMEKSSRDLADVVMQRAERICKEYSNIKVETKVISGDPRDVICEAAERLGAGMLVMGSRGSGFIKRALLGSVSDYCARNAHCPVLIVKQPKQ